MFPVEAETVLELVETETVVAPWLFKRPPVEKETELSARMETTMMRSSTDPEESEALILTG